MRGKRGIYIVSGIFILFLVIVAAPFVVGDNETKALDNAARKAMPERDFIELSDGVTYYEWAGPENGEVVVFVHGLTSPSFIWEYQFDALAKAGFRVLRYDLYGRGFTERPDVAYTADLFDRQLLELLDAFEIEEPVSLVGLSMGGSITVRFVKRHPERVERFALLAPGGLPDALPLSARIAILPGLGEWLFKALGDFAFERVVVEQFSSDPEQLQAIRTKYIEQMQYKGYKRAILSTLRNNPLYGMQDVFAEAGDTGKPALLIWGDTDGIVPYGLHERAQEAIPQATLHTVEGAGHTANYERPEEVNPVLIEFLKGEAGDDDAN